MIFISREIISLTCWLLLVRFRTFGSPPPKFLARCISSKQNSPAWVGLGIPRRSPCHAHTLLSSKARPMWYDGVPTLAHSANEAHRDPERPCASVSSGLPRRLHRANESGRFMHDMKWPAQARRVHDRIRSPHSNHGINSGRSQIYQDSVPDRQRGRLDHCSSGIYYSLAGTTLSDPR